MIKVTFLAHFREITGEKQTEVDLKTPSILEVIKFLGQKYEKVVVDEIIVNGSHLQENIIILKNGNIVSNLKEKLKDGDEITILPPAFGG
ncbi:MAG: MoaD/ThiS family protein [Candidatus Methanofastidiosia archaeon]